MRTPLLSTALILPLLAGCDSSGPTFDTPTPQPQPSITELVVGADDLTTLEAAVIEAGLDGALAGDGPFTVFAPTDDAFAALLAELGVSAGELLARDDLGDILELHVIAGSAIPSSGLSDGAMVSTLNGQSLTVVAVDDGFGLDTEDEGDEPNARITTVDLGAGNGVVHKIDGVLLPAAPMAGPTITDLVVESGDLTTLEAAVIEAGLADALAGDGPFTVFAPTDAAFTALLDELGVSAAELLARDDLAEILQLHVVSGSELFAMNLSDGATVETLNGQSLTVRAVDGGFGLDTDDVDEEANARITTTDIDAVNGVVHLIDSVLLPAPTATITELVVGADDLSTLEAAVIEADLAGALSGEGPFTVFAPTDDAFAALLDELDVTAAELLAREDLAAILQLHVLANTLVFSGDLADGAQVTTLNGESLTVVAVDGGFGLDTDDEGDEPNARIIEADIQATNGVVHKIDGVLLPNVPLPTITDLVVASENLTTLEAAVIEAGLADALAGDGPFTVFAPTDAAFQALLDELGVSAAELLARDDLADILELHVIAGQNIGSASLADGVVIETLNGQSLTVRALDGGGFGLDTDDVDEAADATIDLGNVDILAANGVVHLIDSVLLPAPTATLTDLVVGSDMLTTLEAAVIEADLAGALAGDGPFTVFAPSDDAFQALLDELGITAEELLAREDLATILQLHVLPSLVFSGDLAAGATVTSLSGETLTVVAVDGGFGLDTDDEGDEADARIIMADLEASNGVAHVIDAVLIP